MAFITFRYEVTMSFSTNGMKVVMLNSHPKVGKKYETVDVSRGYGLNFLIPQGLAEVATETTLKRIEALKIKEVAEKKIREDLLLKNFKNLENITIKLSEKANEKGHLFAGIHIPEIILAIKAQTQLDMDEDHIILKNPIKEVGEHKVQIKVGDKEEVFTVIVEAK